MSPTAGRAILGNATLPNGWPDVPVLWLRLLSAMWGGTPVRAMPVVAVRADRERSSWQVGRPSWDRRRRLSAKDSIRHDRAASMFDAFAFGSRHRWGRLTVSAVLKYGMRSDIWVRCSVVRAVSGRFGGGERESAPREGRALCPGSAGVSGLGGPLALIRIQKALSQTDTFGRHFHQFIVGNIG